MPKPRRITLTDGTVVWEVRDRQGGRKSKEVRRRFASSKLAQEFLDDLSSEKRELRQGSVEVGSFLDTTFENEAESWLLDLKLRASPGHYRRCKDMLREFNRNYGKLEPNKITPEFLSRLQRELKRREGRNRGEVLSNATVNHYTVTICSVLSYSALQRRIPFNPVSGFRKLPKNSPEMTYWYDNEAGSFLAWASQKYTDLDNHNKPKARKNYIAYLLALNTGLRAGEIWGLQPHDLIFSAEGGDTIFVRRQFNRLTKGVAPLKGTLTTGKDKSRHVPCPKTLKEELEAMIRFNNIRGDEPIFQSVNGNSVNHDSFVDKFDRDIECWGGRRIRFHDLRHTAATLMLANGIDIRTVSGILGHESIGTTMIYVHLLGSKIKEVSQSFAITPAPIAKPKLYLVSHS